MRVSNLKFCSYLEIAFYEIDKGYKKNYYPAL